MRTGAGRWGRSGRGSFSAEADYGGPGSVKEELPQRPWTAVTAIPSSAQLACFFSQQRFPVRRPFGRRVSGWGRNNPKNSSRNNVAFNSSRVAERKATLSTGCPVREIRFWIDRRRPLENRSGQPRKPIRRSGRPGPGQRQPALVTTHPGHSMEQVAGLLRARWTQENFFKYMREEFGLDSLADHTLAEVDPDEQVVNPGWRFLNNAVERLRRRAADLRLELVGTPRGSKQAHQLQTDIRTADRHLEGLRTARRESGRKMRAGDLSAEDRLQALTTPMRDLFDALRMIVCRAETRLAAALAPGLSRPETARTLVKAMLCGDASIVPDPSAGTLTVRLLHQARRGHDLALAPLLEELNRTRTLYPGTSLRLVYEILPNDPGAGDGSDGDSAGPSQRAQ